MKPAIFLDRDGTLIEEVNYLSRIEDLHIFPFSATAIQSLKDAGFLIVVVTNQSGIGRGIFEEADMHAIHDEIHRQLPSMIDRFYFCPHLPCDGCECRKPGLGMIKAAMNDFNIDLESSWMIGDKKIDVETGQAATVKTALVLTGYGASHRAMLQKQPDIICENFGAAAKVIVKSEPPA